MNISTGQQIEFSFRERPYDARNHRNDDASARQLKPSLYRWAIVRIKKLLTFNIQFNIQCIKSQYFFFYSSFLHFLSLFCQLYLLCSKGKIEKMPWNLSVR